MADRASRRVGSTLGFGPYKGETITGYRIETDTYTPDPDGLKVRIRADASVLLVRFLAQGRRPSAGFTSDEHRSRDWLADNAGRVFDLAAASPQMTLMQFFNTMPTHDAPGGFFLPRGLCELVED